MCHGVPGLPAPLWDQVAQADAVIHAGDWVDVALLDARQARAARLVACWGNNDGEALRARLPERADATLEGLRFTVIARGALGCRLAPGGLRARYPGAVSMGAAVGSQSGWRPERPASSEPPEK